MKVKNSTKQKRLNFSCRLVVPGKSPYWSTVKYYQTLEPERARQMLLEAILGYWLPLTAAQESKPEETEWRKQQAWEGIYRVQQQINFLQNQFGRGEQAQGELKPLNYQGGETASFELRYQPRVLEAGQLSRLIQYLSEPPEEVFFQQKILWASVAYWGAIADRELGLLDKAGLNQSAANCIIRLRQHIKYLEDYFQLQEVPAAPVMAVPAGWGVAAASNGKSEQVEAASKEEEAKEEAQPELDPEIQRLLRGDPETDRYMAEMFASL